jgi:hypothetical protein
MNTYTYNISKHIFAGMINGDLTGLSDTDEELLNKFEANLMDNITPVLPEADEDEENLQWCEVTGYISNCYTVKFVQFV